MLIKTEFSTSRSKNKTFFSKLNYCTYSYIRVYLNFFYTFVLCPINRDWTKKKCKHIPIFEKKIKTLSRSSRIRITKHPPRSKEKNAFLIRFTFEYYFSIIRYLTLIVLSIQIRFFWLLYVFPHEKEGAFFSSTPSSCTKHLYSIRNFEGLRTTYISIDLH